MADISIHDPSVSDAPKAYVIKGSQEIVLKGVTASFDGTGAAGAFVPAVQIIDPSGFVVGTYTCGTTLAAGASADVSWFPGVNAQTGSSPSSTTVDVAVPFDTPDTAGGGYPAVTTNQGFANVSRVLPTFSHSVDGSWAGSIVVPPDYVSTPVVTLWLSADNTASTKATRFRVSSSIAAAGSSADQVYTNEAYVNIAVPTSANQLFTQTYSLSSSPAAGKQLQVMVTRNGSNAADTLTATDVVLWAALFSYTN